VLALILVLALALLATQTDRFLTTDNLLNQGRLVAEIGLVALPMTLIIVTAGIDLSVGSIMGLSAILLGYGWKNLGLPLELSIALAVAAGGLAGFVNGWFIARVGVPPLIQTLATLALYRGLAEGISQARSVRGYPEWFFGLGQGDVLGVPTQLWILAVATLATGVVLARTTFGRALYVIGHNETAARFSGVPVGRVKIAIYTFSGLMAGLAGAVFVSRVSTTRSDMGTGLELDVIAAVVLGGTSIFGGTGTILGTALGVVLIQLLKNGLALTGVKGDATIVVIGTVLICRFCSRIWRGGGGGLGLLRRHRLPDHLLRPRQLVVGHRRTAASCRTTAGRRSGGRDGRGATPWTRGAIQVLRQAAVGAVVHRQEAQLLLEVGPDGLDHPLVEVLDDGGGVEVAVEVGRVVEHLDGAPVPPDPAPLDERRHAPGEGL
jgi:rhamnose transport system permease protein